MTVLVLAYHALLICIAYFVGRRSAGPGIATFFVGVVAFQLLMNGPASFMDGACREYGHAARDC